MLPSAPNPGAAQLGAILARFRSGDRADPARGAPQNPSPPPSARALEPHQPHTRSARVRKD